MKPELLQSFAACHGTPTYFYDLDRLRQAETDLRRALPTGTALLYSLKANAHVDIVRELYRLGCGVETTSEGELDAALSAGLPGPEVRLGGPAKSRELLAKAAAHGVSIVSVESLADLRRVEQAAADANHRFKVQLRINADEPIAGAGLAMGGTASQFGIDHSYVANHPEEFRSDAVDLVGVHLYLGTNIVGVDKLAAQFLSSVKIAAEMLDRFDVVDGDVNIGGGFAWPYAQSGQPASLDGLASMITPYLDTHLPGWKEGAPKVCFESGRFLAGRCGTLVCEVLDVKVSKGRTFVILDAGVNQLGGMSGLKRIPRIVPSLLNLTTDRVSDVLEDCVVAGPLCTPLDRWAQGVDIERVQPGDLVAVPNVGAYGVGSGLVGFLGHPIAKEVVVDGEDVVSASRQVLTTVPCAWHSEENEYVEV